MHGGLATKLKEGCKTTNFLATSYSSPLMFPDSKYKMLLLVILLLLPKMRRLPLIVASQPKAAASDLLAKFLPGLLLYSSRAYFTHSTAP